MKKTYSVSIKIALPLLLGGIILWWMYRGFDFRRVIHVLTSGMDWTWMLLSLPFGVLAQAMRGWRWQQTLEPVGERPRMKVSVLSIFLSYGASLVVPRIGEFTRCGVLTRWDGVSFPKALGTVVTERAIDTLLVAFICLGTLLWQMPVFAHFFSTTGTSLTGFVSQFTTEGWIVTIVCLLALVALGVVFLRQLAVYKKVKDIVRGLWQGIVSLKDVRNLPLFLFYTIGIWLSYFLHFYLTFFCFEATRSLGLAAAAVTFVVGSIAVIVPTPNGAGPWHFAVKTMLILYGVAESAALDYVLIVHTIQTLLVALLGIYAWMHLSFIGKTQKSSTI